MTEEAGRGGNVKKQWYVIHTFTGQEDKVRASLLRRQQQEEMTDRMGDVMIPTENVSEVRKGVRTTTTRKFFPGYILAELALYDENRKLDEKTWFYVRETPGVIGFAGGEKPVPLRQSEVEVLLHQMEDKKEKVKPKVIFEVGEAVKINDGPFMNFSGVIEDIDPERGKLKVTVAIFGRSAPVELEYWQVERA